MLPTKLNSYIYAAVVSILMVTNVYAEKIEIKDLDRRYEYYHATYKAYEDYTQEQQHSWALKVLNERAIKDIKSTTVSYSTSVEKIEILEAYNLKADGRRIDAPKTNYQIQTNQGKNENAPVFSDRSKITTIFPEVAVGDTLVFSYKRIVKEPMFPNYFAESNSFSEATAYDDVLITLIVPESFPGLYQNRGMSEKIIRKDGQIAYQWKWKNKNPIRDTRQDYSVWDLETNPGFAYTTFSSYQDIAEAYGARAASKAAVTDKVITLSKKILGKEKDKREQVRLIYEWVSTNISYAGNCVGVGAVVPHDISFILDNRMGDCKDHATLLQALLSATGIKSEQALVNSGSIYQLPKIPAVNSVNHVINYIPEFDLFVDSTSEDTPFGLLPGSVQGKPALLVENFIDGTKTPVAPVGNNQQRAVVKMNFNTDGSVKGEVAVELNGEPAIQSRAGWRNVSIDSEEKWLKDLFSSNGHLGSATMKKDDPKPLRGDFSFHINFEEKEGLMTESAGGLFVYLPIPTSFSINDLVAISDEPESQDIACSSAYSKEEYTYVFPENFTILDFPKNVSMEGAYLSYTANYHLEKNVLNVERIFRDETPGPICSPPLMVAQREILQKINRSLKNQIIYKPVIDE